MYDSVPVIQVLFQDNAQWTICHIYSWLDNSKKYTNSIQICLEIGILVSIYILNSHFAHIY